VIVKSFDKIHEANLANFGIIPLIFENESSYDWIYQGDILFTSQLQTSLRGRRLKVKNLSKGIELWMKHELSDRLIKILLAGGSLNYLAWRSQVGA
jgi:aconitate hydratase